MIAWGLATGQWTPEELAKRAAAAGYEWMALELDDSETSAFNRAAWPDYVAAAHRHGLLAGCWFTEGGSLGTTPADAELAIAELEGPGDYDGILAVEAAGTAPKCPKAVCTNFSTITADRARPLIDAGYACLTESYLGDCSWCTPDSMDSNARWRGWPTSQPVFGVYNAPPSAYAQWADWPGVDYLGEYVL